MDLARAAAACDSSKAFLRNCVALDSWANVWLKHEQGVQGGTRPLAFADGSCGTCTAKIGPKGIPMAIVPRKACSKESEIDFLPMTLVERCFAVLCGDASVLSTPENKRLQCHVMKECRI